MLGRLIVGLVNAAVDPPRFTSPPPETYKGRSCITCDQCWCVVRGIRYKCLTCPNFDLCEFCVDNDKGKFVHAANFSDKHLFRAIAPKCSNNAPPKPAKGHSRGEAGGLNTAFTCDLCTHAIIGVRHHCMNCPDFDTCSACFQESRDEHFFLHAFEEIEKSKGSKGSKKRSKSKSNEASFQGGNCPSPTKAEPTTALSEVISGNIPSPQSFPQRTSYFPHELKHALGLESGTKSSRPSTPSPESCLAHPADCDFCGDDIVGIRYKCLDCPDFDTCEHCFSLISEQHPKHGFVEIKHPHAVVSQVKAEVDSITHNANCDSCRKQITGVRYKCMHPSCPDYDLCSKCESFPISPHPTSHPMLKLKDHLTGRLELDQELGVVRAKRVTVEGHEDGEGRLARGTKDQPAASARVSSSPPMEQPTSKTEQPKVPDIPLKIQEGPTLDSPSRTVIHAPSPVERTHRRTDKQPAGVRPSLQHLASPIVIDPKANQNPPVKRSESVEIKFPPVQPSSATQSPPIRPPIHAQPLSQSSTTKLTLVKVTPLNSPQPGGKDARTPPAGTVSPISPMGHWVSVERPDERPEEESVVEPPLEHTISLQSPITSEPVTFQGVVPAAPSGPANVQFPSIPQFPDLYRTQNTPTQAAPTRGHTLPSQQRTDLLTQSLYPDHHTSQTAGSLGAGGILAVPVPFITDPSTGMAELGKDQGGRKTGDKAGRVEPVVPSAVKSARRSNTTDTPPTEGAPSPRVGMEETRSRKTAGLRAPALGQVLASDIPLATSGGGGVRGQVPKSDNLARPPETQSATSSGGKIPGPPQILTVSLKESQVHKITDPFVLSPAHAPSSQIPPTGDRTQMQPKAPSLSQNESNADKATNYFSPQALPADSPFASSKVGGIPKLSTILTVAQKEGSVQETTDPWSPPTTREVPIEILPDRASKAHRPLPDRPLPQSGGLAHKTLDSASRASTQVPPSPIDKAPRSSTTLPVPEDSLLIPRISASFVSHNNTRDGRVFLPGTYFEKSWKVKNNGTMPWPTGTALAFVKGDKLGAPGSQNVVPPGVQPGEVVDIAVIFRAPAEPGRYLSYWKFMDHDSKTFGDRIWCDIVVHDPSFAGFGSEKSRFFARSAIVQPIPSYGFPQHNGVSSALEAPRGSRMPVPTYDYKSGSRG